MESIDFIRDYITNQLSVTSSTNEIQKLNEVQSTSANFGYGVVQAGDYTVFYENISNGMNFYIYDKNMTLTKTETLTDNWIHIVGQTLKQDEDGRFYLLGNMNPQETAGGTTYYSLILLNDITQETPEIRKWYKLNNLGISQAFDCQKRVGSADYLFVYETSRIVSGNTVYDLNITQFTISVQNGNSNVKYQYQAYSTQRFAQLTGIGYLYNSEASQLLVARRMDEDFQLVLIDLDIDQTDGVNLLTLKNGVKFNKNIVTALIPSPQPQKIVINGISSISYVDSYNNIVQYNISDNFTNPKTAQLTTDTIVTAVLNNNYVGYITGTAGNYTMTIKKYQLNANAIVLSPNYVQFNFDFGYDILSYINNMHLISTNVFNLTYLTFVYIETAGDGYSIVITTDNSLQEYVSYNSLVPKYVNLYNGDILFSRLITNKDIIGNQLNAEVNIPASMLNDVNIQTEELVSQTYNHEEYNQTINKNIYESLFLNFIKHINVIDNNFGKNELQNSVSALLTESIYGDNAEESYNNIAPIFNARIYMTNGNIHTFSIGQSAIQQVGDYEFNITIAVNGENADKIQILAKDCETVYVTIPLYTVDKVILITQNLIIEEE